jgi:hypothetical protein
MQIAMECKCKDWKKSAHQIFNAQIAYTLRTGVEYTGAGFKYCPWCRSLLTQRAPDLGWVCGFCKTNNMDRIEICCFCDAPRLSG